MALMLNGKKVLGNETKTLTAAEFQQLSQAEKDNGTIYYITDGTGESSDFRPVIYSKEEREVGVWIDGKPLYQKTLTCTSNTSIGPNDWATMPWDEEPANIDFLITGQSHQGDVPNSYATPRVAYTGGHLKMAALYSSTFGAGRQFTVWYTKTTDAPGSGKWTPQGVPAVHYSTDEKIVGTWIDGKTLYEKTIKFNNKNVTNSENTSELTHGISNIDTAFVFSAYADFNGAEKWATAINNIVVGSTVYNFEWIVGSSVIYLKNTNLSFDASSNRSYLFTIRYTKST